MIGLSMYPKIIRGGSTSSLADFCDMVEWTVERVGIDAVGFGSDFYAGHPVEMVDWWRAGRWARESPLKAPSMFSPWPDWFPSPAAFPSILLALKDRGLSDGDVAKLAGGNWLRLFRESFAPSPG